jgi:hypothetical protein
VARFVEQEANNSAHITVRIYAACAILPPGIENVKPGIIPEAALVTIPRFDLRPIAGYPEL